MSDCSHNCGSCNAENCAERTKESFLEPMNKHSDIKKVIGVVSGKGGVGKSLVTSLLAVAAQRKGYKTAILDADITGPSIPKGFGLHEHATGDDDGLQPVVSKSGIKVMSLNLLTPSETDPVVWRGPIIAGAVKQFWTDVCWGDVDYMFVDMPPGTGDVPLTVFQSLPLDGIIIVASPQELVGMIVEKAINMASMMDVPVLGLVENMSYMICPDCGRKVYIFGEGRSEEIAERHGISNIAKMPIEPAIAEACDSGLIETVADNYLEGLFEAIDGGKTEAEPQKETKKMRIAIAAMGRQVAQHFGHCETFIMVDTENGKIVKEEAVANPGHKPGFLPNFLADRGAEVIISGGMGGGAVDIFNERNVEVIVGAHGDVLENVEKYLRGELITTGAVCHDHEYENECGEHHHE